MQNTFFVHFVAVNCFARLQRETSRNILVTRFLVEMLYVFSFTFFFTAGHFHLALVAASICHVITAAKKFFMLFLPTKKKCLLCFFFFISRSRSLSPFFSLSFAGLPPTFLFFSVFLFLYIPNLWA